MSSSNSNQHAHAHEGEGGHGGLKSYLVGFVWAVILTVIPFGLAMSGFFPAGVTAAIAAILAVVQIWVHLRYFLHMDGSAAQRGNLLVFIATAVVMVVSIVGTVWVMYNMNANMMH